jgi:hypothetical protein
MSLIYIAITIFTLISIVVNLLQFIRQRHWGRESSLFLQTSYDQIEEVTRLVNRSFKAHEHNDYNVILGFFNQIRGGATSEINRLRLFAKTFFNCELRSAANFFREGK